MGKVTPHDAGTVWYDTDDDEFFLVVTDWRLNVRELYQSVVASPDNRAPARIHQRDQWMNMTKDARYVKLSDSAILSPDATFERLSRMMAEGEVETPLSGHHLADFKWYMEHYSN